MAKKASRIGKIGWYEFVFGEPGDRTSGSYITKLVHAPYRVAMEGARSYARRYMKTMRWYRVPDSEVKERKAGLTKRDIWTEKDILG